MLKDIVDTSLVIGHINLVMTTITLGEVELDNQVLELQLRGLGLHHIPDLLMEKQYYVHQFENSCAAKQCTTLEFQQQEPCRL